MEVYINHPDKLREDFHIRFGVLGNIHVPELHGTQFDMKIDNKGYESDLKMNLLKYMWTSKLRHCSKEKTSPNEVTSILMLSNINTDTK